MTSFGTSIKTGHLVLHRLTENRPLRKLKVFHTMCGQLANVGEDDSSAERCPDCFENNLTTV